MRYALMVITIFCAVATQALPQKNAASGSTQQPPGRKIPCKTDENASMCYWTRGRLGFYIDDPSYRIWKVGTTRILGVYSGPRVMSGSAEVIIRDGENPEFPANLDRVFTAEYKHNVALKIAPPYLIGPVFGEFELCPLEPEHKGWMQAACIESAKDMFAEMSKRGYK